MFDRLVAELCDQLSRNIDDTPHGWDRRQYVRAQYPCVTGTMLRVILRPGRWSDPDDAWELVTQANVRSEGPGHSLCCERSSATDGVR